MGIPFVTASADEEVIEAFRREGHTSFPVVVVQLPGLPEWTWSGYRDVEINQLAQKFAP